MWHHHTEFLMLGYGAYVVFFQFCKQAFPEISDQAVARMVAGIDVIMYRPDDELRGLARLAVEAGVDDLFTEGCSPAAVLAALAERGEGGQRWLSAFERARDPWFNVSTGDGFYHHHRSWADDLTVPFAALPRYVAQVRDGLLADRPTEALRAERDRIASSYRDLLGSDEEKAAFDQMLGLCRVVFPYVEDHKFYCEHWFTSPVLQPDPRVRRAAGQVRGAGRGRGRVPAAPHRGRPGAVRRHAGLGRGRPAGRCAPTSAPSWPSASGCSRRCAAGRRRPRWARCPRRSTTRPCTCCGASPSRRSRPGCGLPKDEVRGVGASSGVVEGPARVLTDVNQIGEIRDGEILVCPVTAPSWAPVFGKIKAAVSDIGGSMSHAAIVAREYGMPAVVGTGDATKRISTGQRVRVDGDRGIVQVIG